VALIVARIEDRYRERMPFSLWIHSSLLIAATSSIFGSCTMLTAAALHVEWTQLPNAGHISPRRSGHTAFVSTAAGGGEQRPFVFGGYVEVENEDENNAAEKSAPYKRFVTNDLWEWKKESNKWESVETTVTTANDDYNNHMPGPRLVAAMAALQDKAYLFGGWDPSPQAVQAGKFILDTVHVLELNHHLSSSSGGPGQTRSCCWSRLPVTIPDGPISRHVAVSLPSRQQVLIHSHRCQDYVLLFDPTTLQFTKQPTTGACPSSRGLHAATVLHKKKDDIGSYSEERVVFFGGAAQDQTMSNEAFLLDTSTWEWRKLGVAVNNNESNGNDAVPSPRAAPCLIAISDDCVLLFGGAKSTDTGLEPLQDLWALHVAENKWERLLPPPPTARRAMNDSNSRNDDDENYCCPPPRNAATLTPCTLASSSNDEGEKKNDVQTFILTGGWAPFRQTRDDCYILHVRQ
jgi:Galactose oxidase, central domain